jgi:hypothetical protein
MTGTGAHGFGEARFAEATTVWQLTQILCEALDAEVDGDGCIVSRVIGDVLVQVAEHAPDGRSFQLGRGFLVSQFPTTAEVLRTGRARTVSIDQRDPDAAEVEVLRDLAVGAVLMLSLRHLASAWGLVELYRRDPAGFAAAELERAQAIVAAAEPALQTLLRPRA